MAMLDPLLQEMEDPHRTISPVHSDHRYVKRYFRSCIHPGPFLNVAQRFIVAAVAIAVFDFNSVISSPTFSNAGVTGLYVGDVVVWSLTLATNVWTTAMVAYKSW